MQGNRGLLQPSSFKKTERIRKRSEFLRLRTTGKSVHHTDFIGVVATGRGPVTRLGITVTKKVGTAVIRNKIKRLVREYFRLNKAFLPIGIDIHIIAKNSAATKNSLAMRLSLHRLFDDFTRRFHH